MPRLDNPRHEKFCQLVASGVDQGRAYEQSGFNAQGPTADSSASRLVKDCEVSARISEIRAESEKECKISRKQLLDFLADTIMTPAGDIDEGHILCQEFTNTEGCRKIKMPPKLEAADRLCKMLGWDKPLKVEHDVSDPVKSLLSKIRGGK